MEEELKYQRSYMKGYAQGAKDQRELYKEYLFWKNGEQTREQADRVDAFADWYRVNGRDWPTFSDAIEWARVQAVDEVIAYMKKHVNRYIINDTNRFVDFKAFVAGMFYEIMRGELLKH